MSDLVELNLLPLGHRLRVQRGTALRDILFEHGVEFPCGGRGRCRGCKVKVLSGASEVTNEDREVLTEAELISGWRLACRARAHGNMALELAQWEAAILADDSTFQFTPRPGQGVAVDLGTTTIVAQLLDLQTGHVLAVRSALNAQAQHGADIMSRVEFGRSREGQHILQNLVRGQIHHLIQELLAGASFERVKPGAEPEHPIEPGSPGPGDFTHPRLTAPLNDIVIVGNTVMHHLFCGLNLEPMAAVPFEPRSPGLQIFTAADLGWSLPGKPTVRFLPCLGGFVGSDLLAGVLATKLHERDSLAALLDLGTNGEIVLGDRHGLLCASTAAGPAFEGARISMGMRAATGAISEVRIREGKLDCRILGHGPPRGLCGSGLVDAVAAGLELGWLQPNGRLTHAQSFPLAAPVCLTQGDIRELQLAKGAIAAGLRLLLEHRGATRDDVRQIFLAGAFGNYINPASARRIGLLDFPAHKVHPAGNTALLGAKIALFNLPQQDGSYPQVLAQTRHLALNEDPQFQDAFVQEMSFPATRAADVRGPWKTGETE